MLAIAHGYGLRATSTISGALDCMPGALVRLYGRDGARHEIAMDETITVTRTLAHDVRGEASLVLCASLRGTTSLDAGERALTVREGAIAIMREASARADATGALFIRARGLEHATGGLPDVVALSAAEVTRDRALSQALTLLDAELDRTSPQGERLHAHLGASVVILAARAFRERAPVKHAAPTDACVARAIAQMRAHPSRAFTVDELARHVGLSRAAFARRFAASTGRSPAQFLTDLRLALAATRLVETDDALAEIAASIGYATEFAFGRAFKRQYGEAPGRYRRRAFAPTMRLAA